MKSSILLSVFFVGLILGGAAVLWGPRFLDPYLPKGLQGKTEVVEGTVVGKDREPDRLLVTLSTSQGAILATFKQKIAEIDLLIEKEDQVALRLKTYEPFVHDPQIEKVRKRKPPASSEPPAPSSPDETFE